jgi:hypothetical protein
MERRDWGGQVEALAPVPRPPLFAGGELQVAPGQVDADTVAEHVIERPLGRDVRAGGADRDDQLDLVVEVLGLGRVGHGRAVIDHGVGRLTGATVHILHVARGHVVTGDIIGGAGLGVPAAVEDVEDANLQAVQALGRSAGGRGN